MRARRGHFVDANVHPDLLAAVAVGGSLTCVSALRLIGVFVQRSSGLHVHVAENAARLRRTPGNTNVRVHWRAPVETWSRGRACSSLLDALAHAMQCQQPRAAVATLDSALHRGLISRDDLDRLLHALPRRYRVLGRLVDARAESGPETLMRLLLRGVARDVQVQVLIAGVGRVDLLVNGWLVIECDSDAHHSGMNAHRVDRARDLALAARGYTSLRPMAADIMWRPDAVLDAVRGLLGARSGAGPRRGT